jgi:hypothetical protein
LQKDRQKLGSKPKRSFLKQHAKIANFKEGFFAKNRPQPSLKKHYVVVVEDLKVKKMSSLEKMSSLKKCPVWKKMSGRAARTLEEQRKNVAAKSGLNKLILD